MTYQQPSDLRLAPELRSLAKPEFDGFMGFHRAAFRSGGQIPVKTRQLIAIAVAMSTKCPYCIDTHTKEAAEAGATKTEIAEACLIGAAVCAGGAATHALLALRIFDETEQSPTSGH